MGSWAARIKQGFTSGQQERDVAVTYVVLGVVLHLAGLVNDPLPAWQPFQAWWPVPLLLGAGVILLRRRRLALSVGVQLLCAAALLLLGSLGAYFLVFEAVFSIFLLASDRTRAVCARLIAVVLPGVGLGRWLATGSAQEGVLAVFTAGFILLTAAQWATNVRHASDLARSERQRAQALERAAADREELLKLQHREAQAGERTALARQMHDALSARFSAIALLSGALLDRSVAGTAQSDADAASWQRTMQTIRSESVNGLEEMTRMVRMLHSHASSSPMIDVPSIAPLVQSFRETGSTIDYANDLSPHQRADPQLGIAIYRTLNELLVNHAKHAATQPLRLSVAPAVDDESAPDAGQAQRWVRIQATNLLEPEASSRLSSAGTGLGNIKARARDLGGSMRVTGDANRFTVTVHLPLSPQDAVDRGSAHTRPGRDEA